MTPWCARSRTRWTPPRRRRCSASATTSRLGRRAPARVARPVRRARDAARRRRDPRGPRSGARRRAARTGVPAAAPAPARLRARGPRAGGAQVRVRAGATAGCAAPGHRGRPASGSRTCSATRSIRSSPRRGTAARGDGRVPGRAGIPRAVARVARDAASRPGTPGGAHARRLGPARAAELGERLAAAIRTGGPAGVMFHHAEMDTASRDAVSELLALVAGHERACPASLLEAAGRPYVSGCSA